MKKIKVKLFGHPIDDPLGYPYLILSILKKYYEVELSEDPEYLFYNESFFDHYKYGKCIKIYYTGENISPNFNTCDYAISFDYLEFEDRHFRFPVYLLATFFTQEEQKAAGKDFLTKHKHITKDDLAMKTDFCSFVYSNYRSDIERKEIFETLSTYKRVNSAGSYLNNNGGEKIKNKLAFQAKHKFSVAFENSSRSGYTTEKLVSGLVANTIPIYWGNPNIGKEFNTRRFINCHEYTSFKEVLERVKELDQNDDLYLKTVNEPINVPTYSFDETKQNFEYFIKHIIDQPITYAYRRSINPVQSLMIDDDDAVIARHRKSQAFKRKIAATFYQPFKKIKFFENFKQNYFSIKKNS